MASHLGGARRIIRPAVRLTFHANRRPWLVSITKSQTAASPSAERLPASRRVPAYGRPNVAALTAPCQRGGFTHVSHLNRALVRALHTTRGANHFPSAGEAGGRRALRRLAVAAYLGMQRFLGSPMPSLSRRRLSTTGHETPTRRESGNCSHDLDAMQVEPDCYSLLVVPSPATPIESAAERRVSTVTPAARRSETRTTCQPVKHLSDVVRRLTSRADSPSEPTISQL